MAKANRREASTAGEDKWVRLCVNGSAQSKKAQKILRDAGFYVTSTPVYSLVTPEARINGHLYKGLQEIQRLAQGARS